MNARGRTQFAPTEKDRECEISLSFFYTSCLQGIVCYTFQVNGRAVMSLPCVKGGFGLCTPESLSAFPDKHCFCGHESKAPRAAGRELKQFVQFVFNIDKPIFVSVFIKTLPSQLLFQEANNLLIIGRCIIHVPSHNKRIVQVMVFY